MEDTAVQELLKSFAEKAKQAGGLELSHRQQADAYRAERVAYEFSHDQLLIKSKAPIVTAFSEVTEPEYLPAPAPVQGLYKVGEKR